MTTHGVVEVDGWKLQIVRVKYRRDGGRYLLAKDMREGEPVKTWIVEVMPDGALGARSSSPFHERMEASFEEVGMRR